MEENWVLRNEAYTPSKTCLGHPLSVLSIDDNASTSKIVETQKSFNNSRFTSARRANKSYFLPSTNLKAEAVKHSSRLVEAKSSFIEIDYSFSHLELFS